MDYLIPDFDREVKVRVGVMTQRVQGLLCKPKDVSSSPRIYAKVEEETQRCRAVL